MAAIPETAERLHSIGLIDKQTMRQFDEACLTPCVSSNPLRKWMTA
jgi:putative transcriptional regulator